MKKMWAYLEEKSRKKQENEGKEKHAAYNEESAVQSRDKNAQ
jgi:hypothetical protein